MFGNPDFLVSLRNLNCLEEVALIRHRNSREPEIEISYYGAATFFTDP